MERYERPPRLLTGRGYEGGADLAAGGGMDDMVLTSGTKSAKGRESEGMESEGTSWRGCGGGRGGVRGGDRGRDIQEER